MEELFILSGLNRERLLDNLRVKFKLIMTNGFVVIARGKPEEIRHFASQEGVTTGSELMRSGKELSADTFTFSEKMAVQGWLRRQSPAYQERKRDRPGKGQSWGSPEFKRGRTRGP